MTAVCILACAPRKPIAEFTLRVAVSGTLERVLPDADLRSWASIAQPWVFEPLARLNGRGEIEPVLAARVEVLGPQSLRLWIRSDARFEDGSPVTFSDVANSLAWNHLKASQTGGETIIVESRESGTPPELLLARTSIFRRTEARTLGTGPFTVVEEDSQHIVIRRRQPRRGSIGRVVIRSYPTPRDAFFHTLKGDADLLPEVEQRWLEFFEGVQRFKVVRSAGAHANVVAFNLARLTRDERIALTEILAREELRLQAFGDDCVPPERRPHAPPKKLRRRVDVAAVPGFDRFALAVQRTLGPNGGQIKIMDVAQYFDAVRTREFDLATARPLTSPPIVAALSWRTGGAGNVLGYSNAAVDAALDAHDWAAAQRALAEDPPAAFICTPPYIMIVDSRIRNATSTPVDLPRWEIAE